MASSSNSSASWFSLATSSPVRIADSWGDSVDPFALVLGSEGTSERVVDDLLHGPPFPVNGFIDETRDITVERQGGSHA